MIERIEQVAVMDRSASVVHQDVKTAEIFGCPHDAGTNCFPTHQIEHKAYTTPTRRRDFVRNCFQFSF
jgi:hypothetical protein